MIYPAGKQNEPHSPKHRTLLIKHTQLYVCFSLFRKTMGNQAKPVVHQRPKSSHKYFTFNLINCHSFSHIWPENPKMRTFGLQQALDLAFRKHGFLHWHLTLTLTVNVKFLLFRHKRWSCFALLALTF